MKIIIFGKKGCQKCSVLKSRLSKLLAKEEYAIFDMVGYDLVEEDDIVRFCEMECLNISKIPSFYIESDGKTLEPKTFNSYSLKGILGLQTDYELGGTITPNMLKEVLNEAKRQVHGPWKTTG